MTAVQKTLLDGTDTTLSASCPPQEETGYYHRVCLNRSDSDRSRLCFTGRMEPLLTRCEGRVYEGDDGYVSVVDVRQKLLCKWADQAAAHATVKNSKDPAGVIATVSGIEGVWGFGGSPEEALHDLRSVLVDWAGLKLTDGDDDIPVMEGMKPNQRWMA